MELKPSTKYKIFISDILPQEIGQLTELFCQDVDVDPEVVWAEFRKGLRKLKKIHLEKYLDTMEEDDESEPVESDFSKWKRLHPEYFTD